MENVHTLYGVLVGNGFYGRVVENDSYNNKTELIRKVAVGERTPIGYNKYIFEGKHKFSIKNVSGIDYVENVNKFNLICQDDILEIRNNGIIYRMYRADSNSNVIFSTNHCNSNCIMCPEGENERNRFEENNLERILKYVELIPEYTESLCITGGEPTLLKYDLLKVLKKCQEKFEFTRFLMLSNGRAFSSKKYAELFKEVIPNRFALAIPLYSCISEKHDSITRAKNSFIQSVSGIKNLMNSIDIEIRVVVMKQNYKEIPQIAKFIVSELPYVKKVSFMGLELMGNAAINKDLLWIDYIETNKYIKLAVKQLIEFGILPQIYNYPLCGVSSDLWNICCRSISDYKVEYFKECDLCSLKSICGGMFTSTISGKKAMPHPILNKEKKCQF